MGGDHSGAEVPLTRTTRTIVIIVHYLTFPILGLLLYAYVKKKPILDTRVWSPFLLLIAITFFEIGPAFEIGNHFYVNDWELYENKSDLINGSFSFFNFGATNILAVSLRKQPLWTSPIQEEILWRLVAAWVAMLLDWVLAILVFVNPILYAILGRETTVSALSPVGAVSGILILYRVWFNLGPNLQTMLGGIFFFVLAISGVIALGVYRSTGVEWVHIFIGGSFISSVIPLSIGIWYVEPPTNDRAILGGGH